MSPPCHPQAIVLGGFWVLENGLIEFEKVVTENVGGHPIRFQKFCQQKRSSFFSPPPERPPVSLLSVVLSAPSVHITSAVAEAPLTP